MGSSCLETRGFPRSFWVGDYPWKGLVHFFPGF